MAPGDPGRLFYGAAGRVLTVGWLDLFPVRTGFSCLHRGKIIVCCDRFEVFQPLFDARPVWSLGTRDPARGCPLATDARHIAKPVHDNTDAPTEERPDGPDRFRGGEQV